MVRRIEFDACRVDMGLECWLCLRVKNRAQAAQIAYELKDKAMEMVAEIKRKKRPAAKTQMRMRGSLWARWPICCTQTRTAYILRC